MKLLFAGASGYGNVGDDAYRLAFQRDLGSEHTLRFDSPYPDVEAVQWSDAVVIGGGGVIYCNDSSHFEYMRLYMQSALDQNKPLLFSSCGFQLAGSVPSDREEIVRRGAKQLAPWREFLERATSISVRGPLDAEVLLRAAPGIRVRVFPDLCYSLKPEPRFQMIPEGSVLILPTQSSLKKLTPLANHLKLRAASEGRAFRVAAFSRDDVVAVQRMEHALGLRRGLHTLEHISIEDALHSVLPYVSVVVSARYHGHVLARAVGVSEVINVDRRYKSLFEPTLENTATEALGHTKLLQEAIKTKTPPA